MNHMMGFWIGLGFIIVLALGLLIDIVLAVIYWEKWQRFFRGNLAKAPWFFRDVLKICAVLIFIYWVVYLVEYIILKFGPFTKEGLKPIASVVNTVGLYGVSIWIVMHFLKRHYHIGWSALGLRWHKVWKWSFRSSLFYFGFIPILAVLTYLSIIFCSGMGIKPEPHPMIEILKKEESVWYITYLVITAVFVAPIFEEIIFRGLIYQGLKKHMGALKAVLISSMVFSLLHFNIVQFLPVMGLGALLCFIFERTGSLVPVIAIHMLNNGLFLGLFFILKQYIAIN